MNFFLKLKHWQLFILLVGLPFIMQMVGMATIMQDMIESMKSPGKLPDFTSIVKIYEWMPYFVGVGMVLVYLWYVSIIKGLRMRIRDHLRVNSTLVYAIMLVTLVGMVACLFLMNKIMVPIFESFNQNIGDMVAQGNQGIEPTALPFGFESIFEYLPIFLLFYFLAIFGSIYIFYTTAKVYKTAELQRKVSFKDFIGEFFLLWFYFIGVWILQPKINEFIADKNE